MRPFQRFLATLLVILLLGLTLSRTFVHLITDIWWFESVGFADVFWTRIIWQILVWLIILLSSGLFLLGNYWLATYLTQERPFHVLENQGYSTVARRLPCTIQIIIGLISLWIATTSVPTWEILLKYLNPTDFSQLDPIYQRDVGFYIFRLPFYESLQNGLLMFCTWGLVLVILIYSLKGAIHFGRSWTHIMSGTVKIHVSVLLTAIAFLVAIGFWLERFELLYSSSGAVFGAGYTDVHARLHAYWFMSATTFVLGVLFIATLWRRSLALSSYGIVVCLLLYLLVNSLYPWAQQQLIVEPNELQKEAPYIAHNIEFTRNAYHLDQVQQLGFPAKDQLNRQDLADNQLTIDNIRLWDYRPLLSTYRQLQEIRPYYHFRDIDIDRYTLDGNYRQVMLAPRELVYTQVPQAARTWVNQRLKYTHGYGLVMSPVNRVTPQGLPELFIRDIPPVSEVDLEITKPAIYYGEETDTYIFTGTSTTEFDYPQGNENSYTIYEGQGGVPLPSLWRRLAYAYDLGSLNLLISNYFTAQSRIHYRRHIQDRVREVAPFLLLDHDPYIAVIDGKLQWIIDAYTVSDRYPYAKPLTQGKAAEIARGVNYIRNSVKVVVDAYDGTMQFFTVDETDPVLATYRKIFPNLFKDRDTVPRALQVHFRYPLDLFKIQSQVYLLYHIKNSEVFYNREDLWRIPTETFEGKQQLMEPNYVIMRFPKAQAEEFVLIQPFSPVNKDNMIAWMAARSDGASYGKLLLYQFPKQELVFGPSQIEARIDQNPSISQQLTLWSQKGSRVIRGDLLVIPIEQSLLYVEPVYLRAEQGELPELKRVIVAYGDQVVMTETLEQSIAEIFGSPSTQQRDSKPSKQQSIADITDLVKSLQVVYQQAQNALKQGDWQAYGQAQQKLQTLIQQLNEKVDSSDEMKPIKEIGAEQPTVAE